MDDHDFEVEASTPLLSTDQQTDDTAQFDLQPEDTPPPSPRKRVIQIGLVVVAFVVALAVVGVPLVARQTPVTPAIPQPPGPPQIVLLRSNINFGTVTINGKRQPGTLPMFFTVHTTARDPVYQIEVNAPPFSVVTCTVSFLHGVFTAGGSSNCNLDPASGFPEMTANGVTAKPDFLVDLSFSSEELPTSQQNQINTLLESLTLQQTMTVPAGSYIATSFNANYNTITSQRVTTPVQATASLSASTNFTLLGFSCNGLVCQSGIIIDSTPSKSQNWTIEVPTALRWQSITTSGRMLGDVSFPVAGLTQVMLTYKANTGWSLAPSSMSTPGADAFALSNLDCNTGLVILQQLLQFSSVSFSGENGQDVAGCEITVQDSSGSDNNFLWRFGVLMAVDKAAHQALPNLPIAPQAEIYAISR
jgi:hypothetical protein